MAIQLPKILDRGRGPEIAGTRITVYDVMDYHKLGWHRDRIAGLFRLGSADIQAALDYIDAHQGEVEAGYAKILERTANAQYPPGVEQRVQATKGSARLKITGMQATRNRSTQP